MDTKTQREQKIELILQYNNEFCDTVLHKLILILGINASLWPCEMKNLKVNDVYDGKKVKTNITIRAEAERFGQEREIEIDKDIQKTIEEYIEWKVKQNESIDSSAPLFASQSGEHISLLELYKSLTQIIAQYRRIETKLKHANK